MDQAETVAQKRAKIGELKEVRSLNEREISPGFELADFSQFEAVGSCRRARGCRLAKRCDLAERRSSPRRSRKSIRKKGTSNATSH